ncbi:transposase [bacterium]|nr:transposase [bacterium]
MTRPLRIEYDGAWYHVMNRGCERRKTFLCDSHYNYFFSLLKEITNIYGIEIHAYSLMPNHYHLLIHTPKAGLSLPMKYLNGVYTQYYNRLTKRDGPLFKGRYKAILVDSNDYLTELIRYIHQNPVKAMLSKKAEDHKWTSHRLYLKEAKNHWLNTNAILQEFGKQKSNARKNFDEFVKSKIDQGTLNEIETHKYSIIGGDFFKQWVNANFIENKTFTDSEITKKTKKIKSNKSPMQILNNLAFCYDTSVAEIRQGVSGKENEPRSLAIYFLRNHKGYSLKQITRAISAKNENSVAQALYKIKGKLANDKVFRKRVSVIEHSVMG